MAARLMPTDTQRIVRALEVLQATGRSLADWQREPGRPVLAEADCVRLLVTPERIAHAQVIDARFDRMLAAGALDEVRHLLALGVSDELPIMRALGVGPLAEHIAGGTDLQTAAAAAKAETRQYAKRQATWYRRNMIAWKHISTQEIENPLTWFLPFIDR
jgi:tRNA dimethylallyltransferase